MRIFIKITFIINLFWGCKSFKSDSENVVNIFENEIDSFNLNLSKSHTIIKNNTRYETVFYTYLNEKISMISGVLDGNRYGGQFYFDRAGALDMYEYVLDSFNTYELIKDSLNHSFVERGNPLISYYFVEGDGKAKILCKVKFTTYPRSDLKVHYGSLNDSFQTLTLIKNKFIPLTLDGELHMNDKDTVVIKIEAKKLLIENSNLKDSLVFFDTIFLKGRLP